MKLLCIKDSTCTDPNAVLIYKGKTYTKVGEVKGLYLKGTNNNIWYLVAENAWAHHSSAFCTISSNY
jgi:hypothetical protein